MLENNQDPNTAILLSKIQKKQATLEKYLFKNEPKHTRLINTSIILGALTALFTIGPGIGGNDFIKGAIPFISIGIPIWQFLCLIATMLSVSVVIVNGMLKSQDLISKITSARSCKAKLEGLETLIELKQIDMKQAAPLYTQYISEVSHI